ncbi:hypothetical protein SAMN04244560_00854 [Thermoanaerobacter thermohydrosulfuricus]|uniref:Uncharacterized protein n=1 Tax=Thermoanaerobacter thermohydrosulfuricus TaxID=1516 RepID=A0A1G7LR48_THETY|nr:hypothetical protein [Thermoanaerobacter thermohydrosulfuricus]SDF51992.1 hypothetical protein SAMN04244560_00854 [Thermoanaerobacter thermohydrosulfuricus]
MHSNIFQLEERPLRFEEDYACEEDFYEGFVGTVADYVSEDVNREEEIKYFVEFLKKYGIMYNPEEQSIVFPEGFKIQYFRERLEKLKKIVEDITIEEFSTDSTKVWILKNLIEEKYGVYIYYKKTWKNFDEFVRYDLQEGGKYYIGSVLDYRF